MKFVLAALLFLIAAAGNRFWQTERTERLSFDSSFLSLFKYAAYYRDDSIMYESSVQFPVLSTPFFRKEEVLLGHPRCETELMGQPVKVECFGAVSSIYYDSTPAFQLAVDHALAKGGVVELNGDYSIRGVRVGGDLTIEGKWHTLNTL